MHFVRESQSFQRDKRVGSCQNRGWKFLAEDCGCLHSPKGLIRQIYRWNHHSVATS